MSHDPDMTPDLPPPDRFGVWLDRRNERSRGWTDPYRFWSTLIALSICVPGMVLIGVGGTAAWLGGALVVAGFIAGLVLILRYHPEYRKL